MEIREITFFGESSLVEIGKPFIVLYVLICILQLILCCESVIPKSIKQRK